MLESDGKSWRAPMGIFADLFFGLVCVGMVYYVISTYALVHHFRCSHKTGLPQAAMPKVSVLKPVCGMDAEAELNFESFLKQDYADFEVLFGVLDEDDPVVPIILECLRSDSRVSLSTGSDIGGANNKVRILHSLASRASGEILVITDADTRVDPDCLRRVVAPFADPKVGMVTCMYRGIRAKSVPDALEGLHMTCIFEPGAACAYSLGLDFGLGALIAIRLSALDAISGFRSIADYLADDFQLAQRVAKAGYSVKLSDYVVDIVLSGERLKQVFFRVLRWSGTLRICSPWGYIGLAVTHGMIYSLLFLLCSGFSSVGWAVLLWAGVIRLGTAWVGARSGLRDSEFVRRIYLLPICDLIAFSAWVAAHFIRTITWRGRKLRVLKDGTLANTR